MKKALLILGLLIQGVYVTAVVPRPDHVVIVILENHGYDQIIGSPDAPFINSLLPMAASLEQYYGLTHPSQPNYIMLFSGNNQGETTNNMPYGTPWTTPNLAASLLDSGFTFAGYAEDLPAPGSTVGYAGAYARKHCPWINWQGTGPNQIPATCNLPLTHFPINYSLLPDVSFVIPNQDNDMHNGTDPLRITVADQWLQTNLGAYINWCQLNNSLFILTFDEDNFAYQNRVPCIFVGQMILPGSYSLYTYHHYDLLRTLEEMFGLPQAGNSVFARPITEIWDTGDTIEAEDGLRMSVISGKKNINFNLNSDRDIPERTIISLRSDDGKILQSNEINLKQGFNNVLFKRENSFPDIIYYDFSSNGKVIASGKIRPE